MNILGKKTKKIKDKGLTPLEASKASRLANPKTATTNPQLTDEGSKFVVSVTSKDGGFVEHHGRICEIVRNATNEGISTILVLKDGDCEGELVLSNDEVLEVIEHVKNHKLCYGPKISIQAA